MKKLIVAALFAITCTQAHAQTDTTAPATPSWRIPEATEPMATYQVYLHGAWASGPTLTADQCKAMAERTPEQETEMWGHPLQPIPKRCVHAPDQPLITFWRWDTQAKVWLFGDTMPQSQCESEVNMEHARHPYELPTICSIPQPTKRPAGYAIDEYHWQYPKGQPCMQPNIAWGSSAKQPWNRCVKSTKEKAK
jgi:hypothetical protein